MPNDYFQFKQFGINQSGTAMKVGTDGVLLGAWACALNPKKILDIGTGTGLIAIMLAQRFEANIVAIEIEENAYKQAFENAVNCPWSSRIEVKHISFQKYTENTKAKFDLVVSNPPYFKDCLKNLDSKRTIARHNDTLPFDVLINGVSEILTPDGRFCLILPNTSTDEFIELAQQSRFFLSKKTYIKTTLDKISKRILLEFKLIECNVVEDVIVVENGVRHQYSDTYRKLTQDFYLKM